MVCPHQEAGLRGASNFSETGPPISYLVPPSDLTWALGDHSTQVLEVATLWGIDEECSLLQYPPSLEWGYVTEHPAGD